MTIKEKLCKPLGKFYTETSKELEQIADDYAIEFARFVGNHIYSYYENDTWSNDLEKKDLTTKELLEIFKNEKGL